MEVTMALTKLRMPMSPRISPSVPPTARDHQFGTAEFCFVGSFGDVVHVALCAVSLNSCLNGVFLTRQYIKEHPHGGIVWIGGGVSAHGQDELQIDAVAVLAGGSIRDSALR